MLRNVFLKSVRDRRKALLWWTVGIFAYIAFMDAFWPFVQDMQGDLEGLLENLPPELMAVVGVNDPTQIFSPEGYLSSRSFGWIVPVVFALYSSALGARAIAGEEEDNTMDVLLANPVSRVTVVVQKFLALALVIAVLGVALFAALVAGDLLFGVGISASRYAAATLAASLLGLVFGTISLAAGAAGAKRGAIVGIVAPIAVAAFLINSLGGLADWLDTARRASPFYYYDASQPLRNGLEPLHALVLAGWILVALAVAVIAFRRRDVSV